MILWVTALNLFYGVAQAAGFECIFKTQEGLNVLGYHVPNRSPNGFMGNSGIMAALCAMAIPLVATRGRRSLWIGAMLLIPIFILRSSISLAAGVITLLFVAKYRLRKSAWIAFIVSACIAAACFLIFFDMPGMERMNVWKTTMNDINHHPLMGWGMDSFRRYTETKPFVYVQGPQDSALSRWDNPHNIILSLLFEFGIISIFLLGGYTRQLSLSFNKTAKEPNTIALAGFLMAFFLVSLAHYPIFLARMVPIIIPCFALFELQVANG